jgi:hypothetical protein
LDWQPKVAVLQLQLSRAFGCLLQRDAKRSKFLEVQDNGSLSEGSATRKFETPPVSVWDTAEESIRQTAEAKIVEFLYAGGMNIPRQARKHLVRRIVVGLVMLLSLAAPAASVKAAGGGSCGWQTGCRELPVVCIDKETGKETPCPPATGEKGGSGNKDFCIDPATGQVVSCGWQTGFAND